MYSVDTSALLEGWMRAYPPSNFPAVWERIDQLVDDGAFLISEAVLWDLKPKADEVYEWCLQREEQMVVAIDDPVQARVSEIMSTYPKLVDTRTGKSSSDPFVIALAQVNDPKLAVVTLELGGTPSRPKIPSVCQAEDVTCISLLKLIQEQGWTF